LLKIFRRMV